MRTCLTGYSRRYRSTVLVEVSGNMSLLVNHELNMEDVFDLKME